MPATKDYWPLVLDSLRRNINNSSYKAWFSNVEFVEMANKGRKITLKVPSTFSKNYIENKFKFQLQDAIGKYYPQVIHIDYQIDPKNMKEDEKQESLIPHTGPDLTKENKSISIKDEPEKISTLLPRKTLNNLNPKYTFENFVITNNNELAVSVAKSIIQQPGTLYNPVFIYAGVGLGKTHLLQAIGQKMLEEKPGFNIKYITSETFVNHYISTIQKNKANEFREYYRSVDLLLIDDIQFIAGKDGTQEAFFHTFNELHQQNKQIVITSDKPPKSLGAVEERLVSRFEWGMVVDINKPELEDRLAILKDKLERMDLDLSQQQMFSISEKVNTNIRDLEGVLNRIQARIKLLPTKPLDENELNRILFSYNSSNPIRINVNLPVSPAQVIQVCSKVFNITEKDILGQSREKNIALARQIGIWLCKTELDLSFPTIGKIFANRDHTTALHSYNKIQRLHETDMKLKEKIILIKQILASS